MGKKPDAGLTRPGKIARPGTNFVPEKVETD